MADNISVNDRVYTLRGCKCGMSPFVGYFAVVKAIEEADAAQCVYCRNILWNEIFAEIELSDGSLCGWPLRLLKRIPPLKELGESDNAALELYMSGPIIHVAPGETKKEKILKMIEGLEIERRYLDKSFDDFERIIRRK